jgi:hypothetical protein
MTGFLVGLLNTPSPTGYAVEAIEYVQKAFKTLKIPGLTSSTTTKGALLARWPDAVVLSAKDPADVARLHGALAAFFARDLVEAELRVPWDRQQLRGEIFAASGYPFVGPCRSEARAQPAPHPARGPEVSG